jgi:hypothetical protein
MTTTIAKRWKDVTVADLVEVKGIVYSISKLKTTGKGRVKATIRNAQTRVEYKITVAGKSQAEVVEIRKTKKWSKPDDQAEVNVIEGLGAKLVGIKPDEDEDYIVPLVDVSTIAAHLYLFHGIDPVDVREPGGYEYAVELHDAEHANPIDQLHVPHTHETNRPVVTKGPRFT